LLLGLAVVTVLTTVNLRGVRHGATVQNLFTFALLAIFFVFSALGLTRGQADNLQPAFSRGDTFLAGLVSILSVLQIVPYFLAGFEAVSRCSEERLPDFRERHFTAITLSALGAGVFFYVAVILVVALLVPWKELQGQGLVTLVAFRRAFDSDFLVNLILFGAILSLLKVFNGCLLSASRLVFALGRAGMVAKGLASVDAETGTPTRAILFVGILAAAACFLGKAVLVPISEVGSFAFAVGWLAACAAYCRRAEVGSRVSRWMLGGSGVVVSLLMIVMKLLPFVPDSFSRWEYCALSAWVALGLILWVARPGTSSGSRGDT
jgi:amino acid transporter